MSARVYRVEDRAETVGVGYVRARSEREAVEKATRGEVVFDYEPAGSSLSAKWVRDPHQAAYHDPGQPSEAAGTSEATCGGCALPRSECTCPRYTSPSAHDGRRR